MDGVTKLTRAEYSTLEEQQMENLRKMFMAMSKDIRVILIKIADRLHNTRTMEYQTPEKQRSKSMETMDIYAPLAHRLGMQKIKWELEDTSLKYLDPKGYDELMNYIEAHHDEAEQFMQSIQETISARLTEAGIRCSINGRVKHVYSIYRKMKAQNKTIDELYDLYAFRVIVDTIPDCYNVLGHIHDLFNIIPGRFKDYISTPKPNMYQSLHTTVIGVQGIPFEVQIRTWDMHETAEYGIAAHWKYKDGVAGRGDEKEFEWVRRLLESQQDSDAEDYIHSLKVDMFDDEVFVFTPPQGQGHLPALRLHAHRLCLRHPLRHRQHHGGREDQQPHRPLRPAPAQRRHLRGHHLQVRPGPQPRLAQGVQIQPGAHQDQAVVQARAPGGEHRPRPRQL